MPTTTDLVTLFPEFTTVLGTHPAMVQGHLTAAAPDFDAAVWGDQYVLAVCLAAAHSLTMSPYGTHARIEPNSDETIYSVRIKQLRKRLGSTRFALTT